jgi:hypothetical protein
LNAVFIPEILAAIAPRRIVAYRLVALGVLAVSENGCGEGMRRI